MKKVIMLLSITFLFLVGCENSIESENYVKPMEFSKSESEILELVQFNDDLLFLDYKIPKKYNFMCFTFETYIDGKIVNEESMQQGINKDDHIGKLAIEISDEDVYKVQVKQMYSDDDYSISSFQILKDDLIKTSIGFSTSFIDEKMKITDENEITLGVYLYSDKSGVLRVSPQSILFDKKYVEESDVCVIFSLKLLEDFK